MRRAYVYILASRKNGTLYVGLTNDLYSRLIEHKNGVHPNSFTAQYDCTRLVYFERYDDFGDGTAREKRLKRWKRAWKIALIEEHNPDWNDVKLAWDD